MDFDLIILSDLYTNPNNHIEILSISDLIDCLANVLNDYLLLVESGVFWDNQKIIKKIHSKKFFILTKTSNIFRIFQDFKD